jgi:ribosomal protein S27E
MICLGGEEKMVEIIGGLKRELRGYDTMVKCKKCHTILLRYSHAGSDVVTKNCPHFTVREFDSKYYSKPIYYINSYIKIIIVPKKTRSLDDY